MNQGRIIVITGAPGTGKTTTASAVAKESDLEKSVHMHTDDFYHYLSKGAIHYWRPAEIASKGPARKANCGAKEKAITEFFQILYTEQ